MPATGFSGVSFYILILFVVAIVALKFKTTFDAKNQEIHRNLTISNYTASK